MKSKKDKLSATVFYSVIIALALFLPNMAFAELVFGDFYYTVNADNTVTITGYNCPGGSAVIPDTIDSKPVVGIGVMAFAYCYYLTSVTIPDNVTSIGDSAFFGCGGLTSVTIGNGVSSIGDDAFWGCSSLTSVTIPNSVKSIGDRAFLYCDSLNSIVVDENNPVYSSQDGVLYNKVKTVLIQYPGGKYGEFTIPDSVTSIGGSAFDACIGLTSVTIPTSVKSIGDRAFANCFGLTSVFIPKSVTIIGNEAFWDCTGLISVTISDSVTYIGGSAFYWCTSLTSVTIPNSVTSIGDFAFGGCDSLNSIVVDENNPVYSSQDGVLYNKVKTVLIQYPGGKYGEFTIPDSVTSIGGSAFEGCTGLTSVIIGSSVMSIGDFAFFRCTSLTSVTIPSGVTIIPRYAFNSCTSLTSVTIPNSVTIIRRLAFAYCSGLTRAHFLGKAPSMGQDVFSVCASNFIVCFTSGSTGFTTPTWNGYPAAVCSPQINIVNPQVNTALQDGIVFKGATSDFSGIYTVSFYVREQDGGEGIPIGYDDLEASYNSTSGYWEYPFDTTKLQDGNYVVFAKATDNAGNEGTSSVVPFSIRNWAVITQLPSTPNSKAGRTMPIKFSLRIARSVDPAMPFVYNEDLQIRIYRCDNASCSSKTLMQTSVYGTKSTDYRIDVTAQLYQTNFQTTKIPAQYRIEIWRPSNNFLVGSFTLKTVK